jgi:hypothetical protein
MSEQRYVSPELTHFVGRSLRSKRERYKLLAAILRSGRLKARRPKGYENKRYVLQKNLDVRLSSNDAYKTSIVCFCDIPAGDLDIHMEKYGQFGIAFQKKFLLEQGALPVMYVPTNGRPALLPYGGYGRGRVAAQSSSFDEFWKRYGRICHATKDLAVTEEWHGDLKKMIEFLDMHMLSHLKFFDAKLEDWEDDNYYFEREWRISQDVKFRLGDVWRVILPPDFSRQFRRDFERYDGEIVFS